MPYIQLYAAVKADKPTSVNFYSKSSLTYENKELISQQWVLSISRRFYVGHIILLGSSDVEKKIFLVAFPRIDQIFCLDSDSFNHVAC